MDNYLLENLTVVLPSKNSEELIIKNFSSLNEFLTKNVKNFEIMIVSNGSNLFNLNKLKTDLVNSKNITHHILTKSGKGYAAKFGILNSKFNNILVSDADFSVSIDELINFVENRHFKSGLVIGNRRSNLSTNLKTPISRKLSGLIFIKIVNLLFKLRIEDTQCGFKCIDKNLFTNLSELSIDGYSFDIELMILANISKIKIVSIPVTYIHNEDSTVKLFKDSFNMLKEIIYLKKKYKFI